LHRVNYAQKVDQSKSCALQKQIETNQFERKQLPVIFLNSPMPHKILAIDDSIALRAFISKTIAQSPDEFTVVTAKDGKEGLELSVSGDIDVILLDFILPDMDGEAVCEQLIANPLTAFIPVIMMSSSVGDIKRLETIYSNIVKALAKPFTSELLMQTIRYVMRSRDDVPAPLAPTAKSKPTRRENLSTDRKIVFGGRNDFFPLYRAFTSAQHADMTGILWLYLDEAPIQCLFRNGSPLIVTTKDVDAYLANSSYQFSESEKLKLDAAILNQNDTAMPVFVSLVNEGVLNELIVDQLCHEHGARLLSHAWTAGRFEFEFEAMDQLPGISGPLKPLNASIDEWMLESLRHVGEETLSAIAWGDLGGIPIYTRDGYERIQQIAVNEDEAKFLSNVGDITLSEMSKLANLTEEQAQQILYRFLCLNIFEYWPTAILRRET